MLQLGKKTKHFNPFILNGSNFFFNCPQVKMPQAPTPSKQNTNDPVIADKLTDQSAVSFSHTADSAQPDLWLNFNEEKHWWCLVYSCPTSVDYEKWEWNVNIVIESFKS